MGGKLSLTNRWRKTGKSPTELPHRLGDITIIEERTARNKLTGIGEGENRNAAVVRRNCVIWRNSYCGVEVRTSTVGGISLPTAEALSGGISLFPIEVRQTSE